MIAAKQQSVLVLVAIAFCFRAIQSVGYADDEAFNGALIAAEETTIDRLTQLKKTGSNAVVVPIHEEASLRRQERLAFKRIADAGLDVCYWVEVARCPELADEHPDWMASLQGHPEWRRLFKNAPEPATREVVKTFPWVPILNKEPFEGQLARIKRLLADRPVPSRIFLNDLQGAPSACGCGHHLCRWTTDYGRRRTTTPLGPNAAADFVTSVKRAFPKTQVVPVWATECEEHDGTADGLCAGVGCYQGICWKAWTQQLIPVSKVSPQIGVLLPFRQFQRDLPIYGPKAGWIVHAANFFQQMPKRYDQSPIPASRLVAVLQGWDVSQQEIDDQITAAQAAGIQCWLVAYTKIEQSWEPQLRKLP